MTTIITPAQLAIVAPKADPKIAAAVLSQADDVLPRYALATRARLTDFMAHVLVESAYLTTAAEDLNYSASRLMEVWPSRFPNLASTAGFAHSPEALACRVYGGRMGNDGDKDGWLYRGQGLLQITGKSLYQRLAAQLGKSLDDARLFITSEAGMLECAAAVYAMLGAPAYADRGDIVGSTRAINGGVNGLNDRKAAWAKCRKVWAASTTLSTSLPPPNESTAMPATDPNPDDVRALQSKLKTLGLYSSPVDGDFGPGTETAVKAFQAAHGLLVDGVVGSATEAALSAAVPKPVASVTLPAPVAAPKYASTVPPIVAPPHLLPTQQPRTGLAGLWDRLTGKA